MKASNFLLVWVALMLVTGCANTKPQLGGKAKVTQVGHGRTNTVELQQSENPKDASSQSVQSQVETEETIPTGSEVAREYYTVEVGNILTNRETLKLAAPMVRKTRTLDKTETTIGGAQKDTMREIAAKAASLRPVQYVGIALCLGALVLFYFQWWTKGAICFGVGVAMIAVVAVIPGNEGLILMVGLGACVILVLLVAYAYFKGKLDKDGDGVPDILQR